jgi:hypothetical protein
MRLRTFVINEEHFANFNMKRTSVPKYDEMLDDPPYYTKKGLSVKLESMSPKEYLMACAKIFRSTEAQQRQSVDDKLVDKYYERALNGEKMPVLVMNYATEDQNGRHRALVAEKLGLKSIPVLVIRKI